jgi:DHA1 family multidrug resistance protein-like MFS transporter
VFEALVRPIQLMVLDPAIGFTAAYVALCYGIYYSFFEAFPIVYIERYHFNLGEMGLTFLSITAATILSLAMYYLYIYKIVEPDFRAHGLGKLERRLLPALYASFLLPIGLFIFAWTSDGKIHWIVSVIGVFLFTIGGKCLILCTYTTGLKADLSLKCSS